MDPKDLVIAAARAASEAWKQTTGVHAEMQQLAQALAAYDAAPQPGAETGTGA